MLIVLSMINKHFEFEFCMKFMGRAEVQEGELIVTPVGSENVLNRERVLSEGIQCLTTAVKLNYCETLQYLQYSAQTCCRF